MTTNPIYHWRIYCQTESTYVYDGRTWAETQPTACPNNTGHAVSASKTIAMEERRDNMVKIQEELTPTGGYFKAHGIYINAPANSTTITNI